MVAVVGNNLVGPVISFGPVPSIQAKPPSSVPSSNVTVVVGEPVVTGILM